MFIQVLLKTITSGFFFSNKAHEEYEYPESTYDKNPLLTNAAQSVLEFGYLPKTIKEAINNIIGNIGGKKYFLKSFIIILKDINRIILIN